MKKDDNQLLKEFASGFAAIPEAKERFIKAAHECSGRVVSGFYSTLTSCIREIPEVMALREKITHISCYRSGRLAALIRRFTYEMRAEGIKIKVGATKNERLVEAINYYNSVDQEFAEVVAKMVCPDMDFNNLEQIMTTAPIFDEGHYAPPKLNPSLFFITTGEVNALNIAATERRFFINNTGNNTMNIFEKFANKAVARPTIIFGKLIEDVTADDYEAAIRRLNTEIKAFDDILACTSSKKVDAKVKALRDELKEVSDLYDDSDV